MFSSQQKSETSIFPVPVARDINHYVGDACHTVFNINRAMSRPDFATSNYY